MQHSEILGAIMHNEPLLSDHLSSCMCVLVHVCVQISVNIFLYCMCVGV